MSQPDRARRILIGSFITAPFHAAFGQARTGAADPSSTKSSSENDQEYIQRLANLGKQAIVLARATPYKLNRPVIVSAGTQLMLAANVCFDVDFDHHKASAIDPIGVFQITGNGVAIVGIEQVRIRSVRPDPNIYAVLARGVWDLKIANILAQECAHAYITAATEAYANLVPLGTNSNLSTRVTILGGGAEFTTPMDGAGHAACVIAYCSDFAIRGCRYRNVAHGIQWWGGDSDPLKDGRPHNPRKCGPGQISHIEVINAQGASVWGSMGREITIADCVGRNAGDVGFDTEGGVNITFLRCSQFNAKGGCFAVFFENDGIRFDDCTASQPKADQPVFRTYGKGTGDTRSLVVTGGNFICTDKSPGTFDNAYGAISDLTIRNVTFENVSIHLEYRPFRKLEITGSHFRYANAKMPSPAVTVATAATSATRASVVLRNNEIRAPKGLRLASLLIRYAGHNSWRFDKTITGNRLRPIS